VMALLLHPPALRGFRRRGRDPRWVHVQRLSELRAQAFERELTVLQLRTTFRRGHSDFRAESFEEAGALPWPERRRVCDIEVHFGLGVRSVRVLTARTARRTELPLEFVHRNVTRTRHAQNVHYLVNGLYLIRCGWSASAPRRLWRSTS